MRRRRSPLCRALIVVCSGFFFAASAPAPADHPTAREQAVLDVLLSHEASRARPAALRAALVAIEATQRSALANLARGRFVYVRMNPAAGLGNRLVAMVSGLLLAAATDRGFLVGDDRDTCLLASRCATRPCDAHAPCNDETLHC